MPTLNSIKLTAIQQSHTEKCTVRTKQEIQERGGCIGFDEYMKLVLHDNTVGYYHGQQKIFGEGGDFTTAPEASVHLAYCVAHACAKLIHDDPQRAILEIGAGSGRLARDVIAYLHSWGQLPTHYYIYDPSEQLIKNIKLELQLQFGQVRAKFQV